MVVYPDKKSLTSVLSSHREKNLSIGFVPTMGALHAGHLSLVEKALQENDQVVVSIFVNPTQFNNASDLKKYPRNLEKDIALLNKIAGNILIYAPKASDIYPEKITANHFRYGGLEHEMEGKHRKGHFDGVGTIVTLLLQLIMPHIAYFGEKDFQQLQIVKKLVAKKKLPIKIIGCPIVRETNGLAMSSRNKLLNQDQLEEAALIYRLLKEVKQKFKTHTIQQLEEMVKERFLTSSYLQLEYFVIANEVTLKTAKRKQTGSRHRAFIAAFCDKVRLIDNMPLN